MAESSDFPQPTYIHPSPAAALLSETRPLRPAPILLHAVNLLIDELLWLSLDACADPGPTEAERIKQQSTEEGKRGEGEGEKEDVKGTIRLPLTTEQLKSSGVLKVLGNGVGKNAVLEAELAVRELVRLGGSETRKDPALFGRGLANAGKIEGTGKRVKVEVVFAALRRWCDALSPLGAKASSSAAQPGAFSTGASMTDVIVPQLLLPLTGQSITASLPSGGSTVTPALALWTTAMLSYLSEYVLRGIARVVERDPTHNAAAPADLLVFTGEDEGGLWSAFEGMRVRAFVEREVLAYSHGNGSANAIGGNNGDEVGAGGGAGGEGRTRKGTMTDRPSNSSLDGAKRPESRGNDAPSPRSSGKIGARPEVASSNGKLRRSGSQKGRDGGEGVGGGVGGGAGGGGTMAGVGAGLVAGGMRGLRRMGSTSRKEKERPMVVGGGGGRLRSGSNKSGRSQQDEEENAEDAFEELMMSGKTMKVSLTPGRLRTMEMSDSGSKVPPPIKTTSVTDVTAALKRSPSTPPGVTPPSSASTQPSGQGQVWAVPRLKARSPLKQRGEDLSELEEEEEELDSEDERMGYKRKPPVKKESLADFLKSDPPFVQQTATVAPAATAPQAKQPVSPSTIDSRTPLAKTSPSAASFSTTASRPRRTFEPRDATLKRDNSKDLAAFLSMGPPQAPGLRSGPSQVSLASSHGTQDELLTGKPKRKAFKDMMARFSRKDEDASTWRGDFRRPSTKSVSSHGSPFDGTAVSALRPQRSSPALRHMALQPSPPVPEIPSQHKQLSSSGSSIDIHRASNSTDSAGRQRQGSGGKTAVSAIPFGTGSSPPRTLKSLDDEQPVEAPAKEVKPASPKRKPVPSLDSNMLHIRSSERVNNAHSDESRGATDSESMTTAPSQSPSADAAPPVPDVPEAVVANQAPQTSNVMHGLHTPPASNLDIVALAEGRGQDKLPRASREADRPLTPPASPPQRDEAAAQEEAVEEAADESTSTHSAKATGVEGLVEMVRALRQDMSSASSVADCLALMDGVLDKLAFHMPAGPSEAATVQDDAADAEDDTSEHDEATVVAWLFGELPYTPSETTDDAQSDASSIAESGASTGATSTGATSLPPTQKDPVVLVPHEPSVNETVEELVSSEVQAAA